MPLTGDAPTVELRPVQHGDLDAFYAQQRDPASVALARVAPRERAEFDVHWTKVLADPSITVRTVLADGEPAGHVTSFVRDGRRMAGYWLGREHWGRGIATAALRGLLAEVRDRPLHATVSAGNPGSIRVLEKCGFVRDPGAPAEDGILAYVLR